MARPKVAIKEIEDLRSDVEERIKKRNEMCDVIERQIDALAENISELIDHDLNIYTILNKPDSLYHDSPLSRAFTYQWVKQHMFKRGMSFVDVIAMDGIVAIRDFSERAKEASLWAMRFTKPIEKNKTGIDAILDEGA